MQRLVDLIKLNRLDSLIRRAATGSSGELAERLGLSRSGLFNLITFLKEETKAPVYYNKSRRSFVYSFTPNFYLGFERDRLANLEIRNTYGGGEDKSEKIKVEIEIDENDFNIDEDFDFDDLDN